MTDPSRQQQQIQLRIDESKMQTVYANTIRTATTQDEVVLDFGLNIPMQPAPNQPAILSFNIGSRVVMNWTAAKRLQKTLEQAVGAYEQRHGEIRLAAAPTVPPPQPNPGTEGHA